MHPLTPERWPDLAALFDANTVTRSCNCMWFRQTGREHAKNGAAGNRRAFEKVVRTADAPPGVIAYVGGRPAGWCAVAPRAAYPRLQRSPALKPVDDEPAWSITCFFIASEARGLGIARLLLDAAVGLATAHGARIVEGYPVDPAAGPVSVDGAFHGLLPWFVGAGFVEAARRRPARPIMRRRC